MQSVVVYCGSSAGNKSEFETQAYELGAYLASNHIRLVYGGAKIGLMGAVADGALSQKGNVIGVLPRFLSHKEVAHPNLSELILVKSMHERKAKMNELCDAVIVLPGGFGTLEEFFEMLTWAQLGLHGKPIGILNTNGYYSSLIDFMDRMVEQGFLKRSNRDMVLVNNEIDALIKSMDEYQSPPSPKWINKDEI